MDANIFFSIALAIGLAAACGFRVFLPLFTVSLLSYMEVDLFGLTEQFNWIGSFPALVTFGGASLLELAAYYIPYIDNLLDSIAIPLAALAGTIISMSTLVELEPVAQWAIALIAGGGVAGLIKGAGAATRLASTATTGGVANPVVSTVETGASLLMILLAIFIPVVAIVVLILLVYFILKKVGKYRKKAIDQNA
ncbi:MAG: DUF4126 domain-containing protein [Flavobacteriales bacterium]|nr:DUF4126 domain-containing protein [Flavobacteriales bacterium]